MFLPSGSLLCTQQRQSCHFWRNEEGRRLEHMILSSKTLGRSQETFPIPQKYEISVPPTFSEGTKGKLRNEGETAGIYCSVGSQKRSVSEQGGRRPKSNGLRLLPIRSRRGRYPNLPHLGEVFRKARGGAPFCTCSPCLSISLP